MPVLASVYFLIAVFRRAFGEVNPVTASRILASRGLGPKEDEAPSDISPVMRTTFDVLHHLVLICSSAIFFSWFLTTPVVRPYMTGALILTIAMVTIQIAGRAL